MACIILNDRHEPNEQTALGLFEHSERELAYYKTPGYVAFVESMPLTATQKPKRNEIKLLARELLETRDDVAVFDLRSRKKKSKQV